MKRLVHLVILAAALFSTGLTNARGSVENQEKITTSAPGAKEDRWRELSWDVDWRLTMGGSVKIAERYKYVVYAVALAVLGCTAAGAGYFYTCDPLGSVGRAIASLFPEGTSKMVPECIKNHPRMTIALSAAAVAVLVDLLRDRSVVRRVCNALFGPLPEDQVDMEGMEEAIQSEIMTSQGDVSVAK